MIMKRRTYKGSAIEKGGTSIKAGVCPAVAWLCDKGYIRSGERVLDYGAGKYGRNAQWLFERGCDVYAYDPYNFGSCGDGNIRVHKTLPSNGSKIDVGLSVYVLNVVPAKEERRIIADMKRRCKRSFHIVRNDLAPTVKDAIKNRRQPVYDFYVKNFADSTDRLLLSRNFELSDKRAEEFCRYGVKTRRGFQRIPDGTNVLLREVKSYKIYIG